MGIFDIFHQTATRPTPCSGGTGNSSDDAVVITAPTTPEGLLAEYAYLHYACGLFNIDWTLKSNW